MIAHVLLSGLGINGLRNKVRRRKSRAVLRFW